MSNGACDNCGTYVLWKRLCLPCFIEEQNGKVEETPEERQARYDAFWE